MKTRGLIMKTGGSVAERAPGRRDCHTVGAFAGTLRMRLTDRGSAWGDPARDRGGWIAWLD